MANPKTDETGKIQPRNGNGNVKKASTVGDVLKTMGPLIARVLPRHLTAERMTRMLLNAVRTTKDLDQCSLPSFAASILTCSQLGLEPNTILGLAYLIPRNMKVERNGREFREMTCTFQVGYKGYLELARRSGLSRGVYAHAVRDTDEFDYWYGLEQGLIHKPSKAAGREERPITYVYAVCRLKDAEPVFRVLSKAEVDKRRDRGGAAKGFSPWKTDYEAMAQKTGVRALAPWMPVSPELATAFQADLLADKGKAPSRLLDEEQTAELAKTGIFMPQEDYQDDDEPENVMQLEAGSSSSVLDVNGETGEVQEPAPASKNESAS